MSSYGLQLRNNLPTNKFSKDAQVGVSFLISSQYAFYELLWRPSHPTLLQISRAQGSWAARYVKNVCSELYTDYEEALRSLQTKAKGHYILLVCMQETGLCSGDDASDDALGDYNVFADATEAPPTHFPAEL